MKAIRLVISVLALLFSACAGATPTPVAAPATPTVASPAAATPTPAPATPTAAAKPIRIGLSVPLTGDLAIAGTKHRDGYQLCVDLINQKGGLLGRPVELLVEDNRSDNEVTVSQYERFINVEKVDLLLGTFASRLNFAASAVAEKAGYVYPIPSGGALRIWERGFKYIFYFQQNAVEYIGNAPLRALAAYRDKGIIPAGEFPKTAAVVHADEFYGNAIATGLLGGKVEIPGTDKVIDLAPGFLAEAGIQVVFTQKWPEGFTDWLTLANAVKASNPDLVMAASGSPDDIIQFVRALKTVGFKPKVLYTAQGTQAEFKEALGADTVNGIIIHASWHPLVPYVGLLAGQPFSNQDFIQAFQAKYGRVPDEDEAIPFAVCQGLEQAVRAVGSTDNKAIRDWLAARTKDNPVKTIMGDFYWDERGLPIGRDYLVTQWQNGELKFIYPLGEFPGVVDLQWPTLQW
ncbi:MAG TPA: amino acid ABC transporter substrate-binding protein [Thermoflexus sp.]|nr:amino acid ABC transporter substrate-binding protein [Thermoflexus sp.]